MAARLLRPIKPDTQLHNKQAKPKPHKLIARICAAKLQPIEAPQSLRDIAIGLAKRRGRRPLFAERVPSRGQPRTTSSGSYAHSHSIVAGGFDEMSRQTRLRPLTSLMMRLLILRITSTGSISQSAVIASSEETMRIAQAFS